MGVGGYLVGGVETVEVGDMTVFILRVVGIDKPFLQLSVTSDLHGRQLQEVSGER